MKLMISGAIALVLAGSASATEQLDCLQKKVRLSFAHVEKVGDFGGMKIVSVFANNNLPYAISAAAVSYEIKSPGREMAWASWSGRAEIKGGIEPGETREIILPLDHLPSDAGEIVVEAKLLEVADATGKPGTVSCHVNPETEDM